MNKNLMKQAVIKFSAGIILVALLLFLPAGTAAYGNAWLLMGLLFCPMLLLGMVLLLKAPELLRKRLSTGEKETTQKRVIGFSALLFPAGFVIAALDFRFGWSSVPLWLTATASALFLLSYGLYAEVMRENAWLSRTVEVQDGQRVIDTGLYGIVRHPMYAATILMFLSMPLVLGSWVSFLLFLAYPVLMVFRIRNEEAVLSKELPGYDDYCRRIRYRLFPLIW